MRRAAATLSITSALLVLLGIAVLTSTSGVAGLRLHGNASHFIVRQIIFALLSLVPAAIAFRTDFRVWMRPGVMLCLLLLIIVGLTIVFIPGIAAPINGSHRWIKLKVLSVQPSEFVKIMLILLLTAWYGSISRRSDRFWEGFAAPCAVLGIVALGFLKQPDLGSTAVAGALRMIIMLVSGVRLLYLATLGGGGLALVAGVILTNRERLSRVLSVFRPDAASQGDSYQIEQALASFQIGGTFGVGYGRSLHKEGYLPEFHTDCILAMAGEELGLVCTLAVIACYVAVLISGLYISLRTQDKFGRLLAFGMTFHLSMSAAFNIAVVTRMAPTKGLALPFVSYGGSNLMASMTALGLLLSVALHSQREEPVVRRPLVLRELEYAEGDPDTLDEHDE